MRILRVRRGFTTNSSSASEWSSTPQGSKASTPPPQVSTAKPSLGQTPVPVGATVELSPSGSASEPIAPSSASGAHAVGTVGILGLGGFVLALIAGDRLVRRFIARSKSKKM
jgi:hypothetical protein